MSILSRILRQSSSRVGIDISGGMVRAVRLHRDRSGTMQVDALGTVAQTEDRVAVFLRNLCGTLPCAMVIDHPTLRIRRMNLAAMPEGDLLEAIRWNFREHVDCPLERLRVGYTRLAGFEEKGRQALLAFAIDAQAIDAARLFAKHAGISLVSLEPLATALFAAFQVNNKLRPQTLTVGLFLDGTSSSFLVMTQGMLLFSRPLPHGGEASTVTSEEGQRFLSELVIEVERSIDAFCIQYSVERVDDLFVCGPGAMLSGLASHVQQSLGIPAEVFDPFVTIPVVSGVHFETGESPTSFAVATGLAIPERV